MLPNLLMQVIRSGAQGYDVHIWLQQISDVKAYINHGFADRVKIMRSFRVGLSPFGLSPAANATNGNPPNVRLSIKAAVYSRLTKQLHITALPSLRQTGRSTPSADETPIPTIPRQRFRGYYRCFRNESPQPSGDIT